jgi:RimJ/RimL family protein N-acetyltransferase
VGARRREKDVAEADEMMIAPRAIEGAHVRLEPVGERDREEMRAVLASDPGNWELQTLSALGEHFEYYWRMMVATPGRIALAVRDRASGRMAGTSSFIDIAPGHRSLEIGYTFLRPEYRGTAVNPETKLLMLREAFGAGALRVQFSVSAANARSRAAVLKLGAKQEGILRSHRITWSGARRDTVLFSIVAAEWPEVERRLLERLGMGEEEVAALAP